MKKNLYPFEFVLPMFALMMMFVVLILSIAKAKLNTQYVIFLGTNDAVTNQPVCSPDEAKKRIDVILTKHFDGFTMQDALGGWRGDDGKFYHEDSIIIYLSNTTREKVHKAADDLIKEFNQSSVLIQENKTKSEFYSKK